MVGVHLSAVALPVNFFLFPTATNSMCVPTLGLRFSVLLLGLLWGLSLQLILPAKIRSEVYWVELNWQGGEGGSHQLQWSPHGDTAKKKYGCRYVSLLHWGYTNRAWIAVKGASCTPRNSAEPLLACSVLLTKAVCCKAHHRYRKHCRISWDGAGQENVGPNISSTAL